MIYMKNIAMVTTDWTPRKQPITYISPLEDTDNVVCNENSEVIYIIGDEGEPISATIWTARA